MAEKTFGLMKEEKGEAKQARIALQELCAFRGETAPGVFTTQGACDATGQPFD